MSDLRKLKVEESRDMDEIYTAAAIVEKYAGCLSEAIHNMKSHSERFSAQGAPVSKRKQLRYSATTRTTDTGLAESLGTLIDKREATLTFLTKIKTRKEVLNQLEHDRCVRI